MNINLALIAGTDIPFPEGQITIHQPTLKEISFIGENTFFSGCEFLNFSKEFLSPKDKSDLIDKSDFEVLMILMKEDQNADLKVKKKSAFLVLSLLFPDYDIKLGKDCIFIMKDNERHSINNSNYESFKIILVQMFELKSFGQNQQEFNPATDRAKEIANKLKRGREKVAQTKNIDKEAPSFLNKYISILGAGEGISYIALSEYTVFQLFDSFKRFEKKEKYNLYVKMKMAGAKDIEEVESWMS